MSRAGRKRKNGPRHPGGQLKKRKKEIRDTERTLTQPHRRALVEALRAGGMKPTEIGKFVAGEEAESPIGRLWAAGRLRQEGDRDSQAARDRYDAGALFASVVGAYRSVIETPRDVAGSGRGFPCQGLLCQLARENCECEHRKQRYDGAFEVLSRIGRRALMAVSRVAIHREAIDAQELVYLVAGLEALRRHFRLTDKRGQAQYRNTK